MKQNPVATLIVCGVLYITAFGLFDQAVLVIVHLLMNGLDRLTAKPFFVHIGAQIENARAF